MSATSEEAAPKQLRYRIDFALTSGREMTPAELARDLKVSGAHMRAELHRMRDDGTALTRGDGFYFATEATRRQLNMRKVRRGPLERPITSVVERHLEHLKRRGLRKSSIKQRRWVISRLEVWLATQGTEILEATPEQLETFTDFATGPSGRRIAVRNVSAFYRWAVEREDLLDRNPARLLVLPAQRPGLPRPISEERLAAAIEQAHEPVKTWLIIAGWCGLRVMEIAALQTNDIDFDARALVVRDGKGGQARTQPMPPIVAAAVEPHMGRGYLFQRQDPPPGPISAHDLQEQANTFLHRIGLTETMHTLRHRYGTKVYEASGFDLIATQNLLGHRSIQSTVVYARARPTDQLHDVVGLLPGSGGA